MTTTAECQTPTRGRWAISHDAYHADRTAVSHSALETFRRSVPLYHGVYVTGDLPAPEPTPQMEFGSAFHVALLQPQRAKETFVVAGESLDRRTKAGKEYWASLQALGKIVLSAEDGQLLAAMREGVMRNPIARVLIEEQGEVEQAVRWKCPETGLPLKMRADKLFERATFDLKTTDDPCPESWARAMASFGYHRQAPFYLDGRRHGLDMDEGDFYFLAVGKRPPHDCIVYQLAEEDLAIGRKQNSIALGELSQCFTSGNWAGKWERAVQTVRLPRWAFTLD